MTASGTDAGAARFDELVAAAAAAVAAAATAVVVAARAAVELLADAFLDGLARTGGAEPGRLA